MRLSFLKPEIYTIIYIHVRSKTEISELIVKLELIVFCLCVRGGGGYFENPWLFSPQRFFPEDNSIWFEDPLNYRTSYLANSSIIFLSFTKSPPRQHTRQLNPPSNHPLINAIAVTQRYIRSFYPISDFALTISSCLHSPCVWPRRRPWSFSVRTAAAINRSPWTKGCAGGPSYICTHILIIPLS